MHTSFTGSARKPRQVNLSGRPAANPWAALPGSSTKPGHNATNSAVAHAQADRARRQHDREKLLASRKVQKTWRGHSSRRAQKSKWREEWDQNERLRLGLEQRQGQGCDDAILNSAHPTAYAEQHLMEKQLHLLNNFQEYRRHIVRDPSDTLRLLYFARALQASSISLDDPILRTRLARLALTAVRHIKSVRISTDGGFKDQRLTHLSKLIAFLSGLVPAEMAVRAWAQIEAMAELLDPRHDLTVQQDAMVTIISLLRTATPELVHLEPYLALVSTVLSNETLSQNTDMLKFLAEAVDYRCLLKACSAPDSSAYASQARLWQLAYVTFITRHMERQLSTSEKAEHIAALSILLSECANEVTDRMAILDVPMKATGSTGPLPLEQFLADALAYISSEKAVNDAIATINEQAKERQGSQYIYTSNFESTQRLANYAVAMLRAFSSNGDKARHIRSWLWRTTVTTTSGDTVSTLEFLWTAINQSKVFRRISGSHREVLSALREANPPVASWGGLPATNEELELWRTEWRIILFFMELYSFVLKIIDDDEFFSGSPVTQMQDQSSVSITNKRGLPLQDAAKLTVFLKNLAFVLYWNASDLVQTSEAEVADSLAGLFGVAPTSRPRDSKTAEREALTGNGVSHAYLKGLSTSLLRMLHDRDSRRRFVPVNGWLMTNHVDMTGFIPAVVDEEEKRYRIIEEDDDDDEPPESYSPFAEESPRSVFAGAISGSGGFNYSQAQSQYSRAERQLLQAKKQRLLQSLAPRLEILRSLPFFIPFDTRVQIFRTFVYKDQVRRRNGYIEPDIWRHQMTAARITMGRELDGNAMRPDVVTRQHAEIKREQAFDDAYEHYYPLGEKLKEPIQITFIDKFGAPEAGIDGGGVTKEFLTSVTTEALDPTGPSPMFVENKEHYLYPNPTIWQETVENLRRMHIREGSEAWNHHLREFLRRYEFLGRIIGKCLYEGILIDVGFAGFFLLKWALTGGAAAATNESGYRASINDLREYDQELYQGLLNLKSYTGDVEADFGLNFTVNDTLTITDERGEEHNMTQTSNLIPDGGQKAVDKVMRHLYIDRLVKYRLQDQPEKITNAFLRGLGQIISPSWLAMFNQKELQKLVGGDNSDLDLADLRRNTMYGGLYVIGDDGLEHPTVELFWKAMQEMTDEDRRKVLKFVTSTPRAPLLGFSNLFPKFTIRDGTSDRVRLPSASTCVNMLKLPKYENLDELKGKLLYAVNSGAGFDLS